MRRVPLTRHSYCISFFKLIQYERVHFVAYMQNILVTSTVKGKVGFAMPPDAKDYAGMSLDDFIAQPDVVDVAALYSDRFRRYIQDKPFVRVGTVLEERAYAVVYTPADRLEQIAQDLGAEFFNLFPQLLVPLGLESTDAAGITAVWRQPYLNLTGQGVLIGFIDTGIDYTQPSFLYEDGTSKIDCLWDQTVAGNPPHDMRFGSVYTREMLNAALMSDAPYAVVPSRDTGGHGTFLASVAAGREVRTEEGVLVGAAPDAEIVVVKLREANAYYKEKFGVTGRDNIFSSTDFMLGVKFILDRANELNYPLVVCIGLGSNYGSHIGDSILESYLTGVTRRVGRVVVGAAGNESNRKHHAEGRVAKTGNTADLSIHFGKRLPAASFYIWNAAFDKISIEVVSPISETTGRIPVRYNVFYRNKLRLEDSVIMMRYLTGAYNVAIVTIEKPAEGIWNVILYGDSIIDGEYHAWMPVLAGDSEQFFSPTPYDTIVIPATSPGVICVGAYNSHDNSLFLSSSWGPDDGKPRPMPDFVAPGVNVLGAWPLAPGTMTGTSAAAATAAGACALLLQWGIVQENEPAIDQGRVRALLISGCVREDVVRYPNAQWGYGKLNLFNVFNFLKES